MLKKECRQHLKLSRQKIDPMRRKEASKQACEKLKTLTQYAPLILSFASFGSEIDLWPFNEMLANEGRLVLPRITDQELHLYQVKDFNDLKSHAWGVLEPTPARCTLVDLSTIAIALIPGLGFDLATKTRLGYGGGFYDRLLAHLQLTEAWGVGFLEQAVEGLSSEPHDKHLSKILLF